ncbi:MAG: adenosylmethionine--8-amino-7-oxononanoate transaminase [Bacteroidota bacterium]
MNWEKLDKENIWHPFSPLSNTPVIHVKKGRGVYLQTSDNRWIMDCISSWWVNIHGHANKQISRSIAKQVKKLEQVIFAGFTHEPAIKLSQMLLKLLPKAQSKIFFSDDGSTSVEVALKLAIQYWKNLGISRKRIIAIEGAYHGDTFGSMSVGERGLFNLPFHDFLFEVDFIPFPDGDGSGSISKMKELVSDDTAIFIFEPLVQGAAGMRMYDHEVLDQLIEIARSKNVLCIADEVMTGFGRTGKTFACDYLKNKPDIFCLSKGITGGFLPMGVTTISNFIADSFDGKDYHKTFFHGHSYTANPLACAAAVTSLKILNKQKCKEQIQMITDSHAEFVSRERSLKNINEVRALGTILRVDLFADDPGYVSELKEKIYDFFLEKNLLIRPLGNVIYVLPPYVINKEELEKVYSSIDEFLRIFQSNFGVN